ncbi:NADPH-dependent oxidoreductase [Roseitranquillus sediminis]|uniref:NADPH-dependent oxidoreductase n=1 Tax=Roseitranquillus sediminis TaxID=2809051 RepID=UPI001D0C111A|nr:NADPH-dependent oxidoreductase [Roseitranquillus sediminis]MBM9594713.1 NADPH-dependent oxidoreductase [Roseitranquillus sediminis]
MKIDATLRSSGGDDALSALFEARYAGASQVPPHRELPVLETLLSHRSVRAYLPEPVPDDDVAGAIAAAQSAATSSNLQAWNVIEVRDAERKARLAHLANDQKHIREAPLLLVWLADLERLRRVAELTEHASEALDYLEMFVTGAIDAALAAQNATVAFEAMGYGTCYIGSMRSHPEAVAAELALPPRVFAVFGMTVGREDPERETDLKPRLPQHAVRFPERYGGTGLEKDVANYDAAMRQLQERQRMPVIGWSTKTSKRVEGAASLKNRDKLKGFLRGMGFGLR